MYMYVQFLYATVAIIILIVNLLCLSDENKNRLSGTYSLVDVFTL